jgi:transposase
VPNIAFPHDIDIWIWYNKEMKPLPKEKRELIISAKKRGEKEDKIAMWLDISVRSVSRIWKLYQETESIQPKKQPGKKPSLTESALNQIRETIRIQPDITLEELIETLNVPIKKSRLSVILIGMGLSFKKDLISKRTIKGRCPKGTYRMG